MIYGVELLEVIPHLETFVARDLNSRGNLGCQLVNQLDNQLVSVHTSTSPFERIVIEFLLLSSTTEMGIPLSNCLPLNDR